MAERLDLGLDWDIERDLHFLEWNEIRIVGEKLWKPWFALFCLSIVLQKWVKTCALNLNLGQSNYHYSQLTWYKKKLGRPKVCLKRLTIFFFKKSKWDLLLTTNYLPNTRCAREESQKIQHNVNKVDHKLANTQTKKMVLTPIMKTVMKSTVTPFIPPKWKKLNTLHKVNRRIFYTTKKTIIISFQIRKELANQIKCMKEHLDLT